MLVQITVASMSLRNVQVPHVQDLGRLVVKHSCQPHLQLALQTESFRHQSLSYAKI
jgi:hypothetical protein